MRLSIMYPLVAFTAGCGLGVASDPAPIVEDPATTEDPPVGKPKTECDAAGGPLHPFTTGSEMEALLAGRWRQCSGDTFMGKGELGIEFVVESHKFFALVDDGKGGLVRKTGFDSEGTWETFEDASTTPRVRYYPVPNGFSYADLQFEDGPRRLSARLLYRIEASIFVAIP